MENLKKSLTVLALAGNMFFILWILYNGIAEGFQGTLPEKISYITLMVLLATNAYLLLKREKTTS